MLFRSGGAVETGCSGLHGIMYWACFISGVSSCRCLFVVSAQISLGRDALSCTCAPALLELVAWAAPCSAPSPSWRPGDAGRLPGCSGSGLARCCRWAAGLSQHASQRRCSGGRGLAGLELLAALRGAGRLLPHLRLRARGNRWGLRRSPSTSEGLRGALGQPLVRWLRSTGYLRPAGAAG